MKFRQHIPSFIEIGPEGLFEIEFNIKDELLNNKWIKSWSKDKGFYQYAFSPKTEKDKRYAGYLMVEHNKGKDWWVLGYLSGTDTEIKELGLPIWSKQNK